MRCCKVKLHTVCLRKYLSTAEAPSCVLCQQEICKNKDKDLYNRIPNTVFKSKWGKEMAQTQATTAEAAAFTPSTETEPEATVATSDAAPDDDTASYQTEEDGNTPITFGQNVSAFPPFCDYGIIVSDERTEFFFVHLYKEIVIYRH